MGPVGEDSAVTAEYPLTWMRDGRVVSKEEEELWRDLMREVTRPVRFMNFQWSREQKWTQVWESAVHTRTSRKTEIVTFA